MLVFILYCLFHQKWSINAIVLLHHYVSLERFVENNACISSLMWCWFLIWPLELILVIHLKPWDLFGRARRAAPKVILWGPLPNTENHSTPSHCHSLKWTKMLGTEKNSLFQFAPRITSCILKITFSHRISSPQRITSRGALPNSPPSFYFE